MIDRVTLKSVAKHKLKAAKILFDAGDYDTAGYLIGYVVECGLKAAICKRLKLKDYPDTGDHRDVFASHSFDRLIMLSGYSSDMDIAKTQNSDLFNNWSILTKDWKPEIRYNQHVYTSDVIIEKFTALNDPINGFLKWLKGKW